MARASRARWVASARLMQSAASRRHAALRLHRHLQDAVAQTEGELAAATPRLRDLSLRRRCGAGRSRRALWRGDKAYVLRKAIGASARPRATCRRLFAHSRRSRDRPVEDGLDARPGLRSRAGKRLVRRRRSADEAWTEVKETDLRGSERATRR